MNKFLDIVSKLEKPKEFAGGNNSQRDKLNAIVARIGAIIDASKQDNGKDVAKELDQSILRTVYYSVDGVATPFKTVLLNFN